MQFSPDRTRGGEPGSPMRGLSVVELQAGHPSPNPRFQLAPVKNSPAVFHQHGVEIIGTHHVLQRLTFAVMTAATRSVCWEIALRSSPTMSRPPSAIVTPPFAARAS